MQIKYKSEKCGFFYIDVPSSDLTHYCGWIVQFFYFF